MTDAKKSLAILLAERERRAKYDKFHFLFFQDQRIDENGQDISRKNYPKHVELMNAGKHFKKRVLIAPNRTGKTHTIHFETVAHFTRDYPEWWDGHRFPIGRTLEGLICGKTLQQMKASTQQDLTGSIFDLGSGMFPQGAIVKTTGQPGAGAGCLQDIYIQDKTGTVNHIAFATYEQGKEALQGRKLDFLWLDEECLDESFVIEAITRTITTNGIVVMTFTPVDGMTPLIMRYMPERTPPVDGVLRDADGNSLDTFVTKFSVDDAPHLTEKMKKDMLNTYPEGPERDARYYGIPAMGSGHIYPVPEEQIVVEPFIIPDYYEKAYGLDFGWHRTAAVWAARDPHTNVIYLYGEYYQGHQSPYVHVGAIKERGDWIMGVADPSGGGTNQADGSRLIDSYTSLGLNLIPGDNAINTGIARNLNMLESGQIKVFSTMSNWLREYRTYRYGDDGKPAREQQDHLMDAWRYLMSRFDFAGRSRDTLDNDDLEREAKRNRPRDKITGY